MGTIAYSTPLAAVAAKHRPALLYRPFQGWGNDATMPTHGWRHGLPCIAPSGAIPKWRGRRRFNPAYKKISKRGAILFGLLLSQNTKCDTLYIVNKSFVSRFGAERPRKDAGACSRSFGSRVCLGIFFALARGDTGKMPVPRGSDKMPVPRGSDKMPVPVPVPVPRGMGILPMLDSAEVRV